MQSYRKMMFGFAFWGKYLSFNTAAIFLALFHISVHFPTVAYSSALKCRWQIPVLDY
jgi:hypothetical protein